MVWATVSSWSCFCWLYTASSSLAAKNMINLISVLTIWWCPCIESSLVLLEEGICYEVQFQTPPKHSFTHRRMMTSFSSSCSLGSLDSAIILLLLSHFSPVRHCATPWMAAHPALAWFSKQEHWSGLPFPSPTYESEKWKWNQSVVSDPQRPIELQPSRLLPPWDFPGKSTGVGCRL